MKFEMDKVVKKSEELVKKGEGLAKDMLPKVKEATSDLKESLSTIMDKGVQGAQNFFEKKDDVKDEAVQLVQTTKKEVTGVFDPKSKNKKHTGKIIAGVAVAAAAATAYAVYRRNKKKNEDLKKEYAEKLIRWAELDLQDVDTEADALQEPVKLVPDRVYTMGSNAQVGDLLINISNPKDANTFNPDEVSEPLKDLGIKKVILDKTGEMKEKIITKIEEGKLQTKLGSMEAKDKYVEIKDLAEDKIEELKHKVDDHIPAQVKEKAEELKLEAEIKAEVLEENLEDAKKDAKKKFEELKSQMSDTADVLDEKAGEALKDADELLKNDMAMDEEGPNEDAFVDAPFGAQEVMEEAESFKEKAVHLAESAKEKFLEGEKESLELVEYDVTIHNKGDEAYFFNPMQLQLYDVKKRAAQILVKHAEGTTLGRVTVKPGETYTGKLFVHKNMSKKHGVLFFEDLSLQYSILFLGDQEEPVDVAGDLDLDLDEDYLYSDEEVLEEHVDYKRL